MIEFSGIFAMTVILILLIAVGYRLIDSATGIILRCQNRIRRNKPFTAQN